MNRKTYSPGPATIVLRRKGWDGSLSLRRTGGEFIKKYPVRRWREEFPNFDPDEFASEDTGDICMDWNTLGMVQRARTNFGHPFMINSAFRTKEHNKAVGGEPNSMHLYGKAVDISVIGIDPLELHECMQNSGFTAFGAYPDSNFLHCDTGPQAKWGNWKKWGKPRVPIEKQNKQDAMAGLSAVAASAPAVLNGVADLNLPVWVIVPTFILAVGFIGFIAWRRTRQ